MPSRELTYRINLRTSDARREARNIRRAIESELRSIDIGQLNANTSGNFIGQSVARNAQNATRSFDGLNRALGVFGVALGAAQVYQFTVGLGNLATEAARSQKAFELLSGGVSQAATNIRSIQEASGGTVSSLDAIRIGNQAAALSLAQTAAEFEQVTRAGRVVALISPVINEIGAAISELGLASANLSFRRLDQLGLSVSEVRDGMQRLREENEALDDSQLFLRASMEALEAKGGELLDSVEAQATGYERLAVAIAEARQAAAQGPLGQATQGTANFLADSLNEFNVFFSGVKAEAAVIESALESITEAYENQGNILQNVPFLGDALKNDRSQVVGQLQEVEQIFKLSLDALSEDPSLVGYQQQINKIVAEVARWTYVTDEQLNTLRNLYDELERQQALNLPNIEAQSAEEAARAAAEQRAASISESGTAIGDSLLARAVKSIDEVGIERAIATLKEQRSLLESAITELINSSVTNPDEIALRLAEIESQVTGFFDQVEAMSQEVKIDFPGLTEGLAGFDLGFVDFLPEIDGLRDRLIDLQTELAYTSTVSAEQAAELEYLLAISGELADESSFLTAAVNSLGSEFISSNEHAQGLIEQMYLAQGAMAAGEITAENFAGIISVLAGELLALAEDAGIATGDILALISAFAGLSGTAGFNVGTATAQTVAQRIETQQAERERRAARQAAERAAREAERKREAAARKAQRDQQKAAREAQRAQERAAKELEKAARELQSALGNVPGLFSRSPITERDFRLTEAGLYQDAADEWLRRLQSEVEGTGEFADVSIEEAKEALERVGIKAADDAKIAFEQFAEAWESSVLFADEANLSFINQEAVQRALDLQEKAKQGQENIYALFNATVEEAVDAVVTGAGGTVSGGVATLPISAQLIPATEEAISGATRLSPIVDIESIQAQLDGLVLPSLEISAAGVTDIEAQLSALTSSVTVTAILDDGVGQTVASAMIEQFAAKTTVFNQIGAKVGRDIKLGIDDEFRPTEVGGEVVPALTRGLVNRIGQELQADTTRIRGHGLAIGGLIQEGIAESFDGETGIASKLDSLTATISGVGFTVNALNELDQSGVTIAQRLEASIASSIATVRWENGEIVAPVADGLVTAINTQVRGSTDAIRREGEGVASILLAGLSGSWTTGEDDNSIALGLLGALGTQLVNTESFFYATGQLPAQSVLSGYTAFFAGDGQSSVMVDPMLDGITAGIRLNAENLQQRGGTMAQYVQHGFTQQFKTEEFKASIINLGELMATFLKIGILRNLNGIADEIVATVVNDIATEVEATE